MKQAAAIDLYNRVSMQSDILRGAAIAHDAPVTLTEADNYRFDFDGEYELRQAVIEFLYSWAEAIKREHDA